MPPDAQRSQPGLLTESARDGMSVTAAKPGDRLGVH
jgi:hypothetical protein